MKRAMTFATVLLMAVAITVSVIAAQTSDADKKTEETAEKVPAPDVDEQIAGLEAMCAANSEARSARHKETPLFERLGGEEGIHALTREIVRLHLENEAIDYMFKDLDADKVAHRVALFVISGTGGPAVYDGPELKVSHADMGLTNADFLTAGGDVIQAMKNLGYKQDEIDEVVCILVSLRGQVVLAEEGEKEAGGY
ncbi:MAG: group 1 truncated hemoglobin [Candidatus Latescibacterota bacterium]|nr:MAG: group 1 truncated hemoglobin [Candidatus Latescibacterota bacterium]